VTTMTSSEVDLPNSLPPPGPGRSSVLKVIWDLRYHNTLWIFLVLAGMIGVFSGLSPGAFATVINMRSMATDAATFVVMGIGATYVIVTAGIDLSCGSVLVFSGVVSAEAMNGIRGVGGSGLQSVSQTSASWEVLLFGLVVALAGGLGWGLFNGLLVAFTEVPPLIVTLGSFGMALGAAQLITGGTDLTNIPSNLSSSIGNGSIGGIPWLVLIAVAIALVGGVALGQTPFGRHTYAIGSNVESARRAGIRVRAHLVQVYLLAGLLAGLAGYLNLARFSTTTINGHTTDNLSVIAGVVLGGTSLFGGSGSIFGSSVGILIPVVLAAGFVITGVVPFWQEIAVGAVLITAVYLDISGRRSRLAR
jgi:ribose transport system permease protein